ncbi:MAG: class I SAM-dependent methyltransferase, partial [Planctomycetota bacterium]
MSSNNRIVTDAELCHERLGDQFASALSDYDTSRRVEILIDDFLASLATPEAKALDVGCGLGFFSEALHRRGVDVLASDLGSNLVQRTKERVGCEAVVADALSLSKEMGENQFDIVISSECIEHTPDPGLAISEMAKVLKPGGYLSLSTPNLPWQPIVRMATRMKLRPFNGNENFTSWGSMRRILNACDLEIVREYGLHPFPFQLGMNQLSRWIEARAQFARAGMINVCVLARKKDKATDSNNHDQGRSHENA